MKLSIFIVLSLIILIALVGCNRGSYKNNEAKKYFGEEKYAELQIECTDKSQLSVANNLIEKARKVMCFTGSKEQADTENFGALSQYYYFNSDVSVSAVSKADVDIQLITTKQEGNPGFLWVKYAAQYYDEKQELISGQADILSRWEIAKQGDGWIVTAIDEMP